MTSPVGAVGKMFETQKDAPRELPQFRTLAKKILKAQNTVQKFPPPSIDGKGLIVDIKA